LSSECNKVPYGKWEFVMVVGKIPIPTRNRSTTITRRHQFVVLPLGFGVRVWACRCRETRFQIVFNEWLNHLGRFSGTHGVPGNVSDTFLLPLSFRNTRRRLLQTSVLLFSVRRGVVVGDARPGRGEGRGLAPRHCSTGQSRGNSSSNSPFNDY
jgi:hypothetical protein